MADQFSSSVEHGLKLAKRIYYGKDRSFESPILQPPMEKSLSFRKESYVPASPMLYAVILEPSIVENPDIMSYQPYIHGRCDPPALIPLHMHEIAMDVDCYLDTAFVTVSGTWRLHCVTAARSCDCLVAIPMGDQGSLLGIEVDVGKSYRTQLVTEEDFTGVDKVVKRDNLVFLMPQICTLRVPQIFGGSSFSLKAHWSQKLLYHDGECCLWVPFSFPDYVIPIGKKLTRSEKIQLNVYSHSGREVLFQTSSHPLKELRQDAEKLGFLYEAEVHSWSAVDFNFSYTVSPRDMGGGLFLQSPPLFDFDQRELFCIYIFPERSLNLKVFRKEVIFVVDISGSMRGTPFENVKNSILVALSNFCGHDYFNILAFNGDSHLFSSTLERITKESTENAARWFDLKLNADGATNIFLPLTQAIEMFSKTDGSIPLLFLITDGTVEDERHICSGMEDHLTDQESICPRIYTFGIGSYCNHYFLRMLAHIGRGYYDAAYNLETIECKLQRLIASASSIIIANITIDGFDHLDAIELYPSQIPDLVDGSPLILSGRSNGKFPSSLQVKGFLADMSSFVMDIKLQDSKDIPLYKVLARSQIDVLTAQAWWLKNTQIERKVAKLSRVTGFPSEYTFMVLIENYYKGKHGIASSQIEEGSGSNEEGNAVDLKDLSDCKRAFLVEGMGIGFGDVAATVKNYMMGKDNNIEEGVLMKAASGCCGSLARRVCCICCLQSCERLNEQCVIALSQLCAALACFECVKCCFDLCASCD